MSDAVSLGSQLQKRPQACCAQKAPEIMVKLMEIKPT